MSEPRCVHGSGTARTSQQGGRLWWCPVAPIGVIETTARSVAANSRPYCCQHAPYRCQHAVVAKRQNWWAGNGVACTSPEETFHFRKQFMSRNLAEPVADARLCCARAPAHRHVAPRRPRSELFIWQRLRCPKGPYIGKRGEGRWWVRSPANSRTSFSEGQKDFRKFDTDSLEPFEPLRGGASGGPKESVSIIAVLELTSLCPLRPDANSSSLR